jgi:hypothetical protein
MQDFTWFIHRLNDWGVADVLLPFLLVFTIIFAVLQKSHILGKEKKNFNVMIALVMGLAVVFPHVLGTYPADADPVNIINQALPNVSIVIIAIMAILLLIGLLGGEVKWIGSSMSGWIAIICFLVVIYIFGDAAGWFSYGYPPWLSWLDNSDTQALIVILLVFGILVWYITKDDNATKGAMLKNTMEDIGKLFKKD